MPKFSPVLFSGRIGVIPGFTAYQRTPIAPKSNPLDETQLGAPGGKCMSSPRFRPDTGVTLTQYVYELALPTLALLIVRTAYERRMTSFADLNR